MALKKPNKNKKLPPAGRPSGPVIVKMKQFADLAGVTRAGISYAAKEGHQLFTAVAGRGKIDVTQIAAKEYLIKKGKDPDQIIKQLRAEDEDWQPSDASKEFDPNEVLDMTVRQITEKFGNTKKFKEYLNARKTVSEIVRNEVDTAKKVGTLVSRELVHKGIIDPIDSAFTRLVTDVPKTSAVRAMTMMEAGEAIPAIEAMLKDQNASVIRPVKSKVKREFKNV